MYPTASTNSPIDITYIYLSCYLKLFLGFIAIYSPASSYFEWFAIKIFEKNALFISSDNNLKIKQFEI